MESLMKGLSDDDNDDFSDDYEAVEKIHNRNLPGIEEDTLHTDLLESIGQSLGSRVDRGTKNRVASKIVEYQSLSSEDRGALPAFRGVKSVRKSKKASKKKSKDTDAVDVQELFDEVYDDPAVTKPVLEKAKRSALYENAKKDVSKWNPVVYHNRVAEQIVYPLNNEGKVAKRSMKDTASEFVPQTPLEEEMAKILYGEDFLKKKKNELHSSGENRTADEAYMLSIEEALEKHSELARLRAVQSYEMAKAKRRNKIKSKKYHRLLRREKIKKQLKEFEELKETNPEAAQEKLDILDRSRIAERMTLKHRNTSKWAKMQAARAKYNKDSRIALSEQLKISKDLTQKNVVSSDDSESDEETMEEEMQILKKDTYDIQDFKINSSDINLETSGALQQKSLNLISIRSFSSPATEETPITPIITPKSFVIDANDFVVINSKPKHVAKDIVVNKELLQDDDQDLEGDDEGQKAVIAEAFEDDDVVADFQKLKSDEIEAAKPKDVNLSLPGWGEWGGSGVKPSRKKKKFVIKAPVQTRKDSHLPHVIINEKAKRMLRDHQVRQLPFPFNRVRDYEKITRAPVGRTWLPEKAMKSLIAPKIITKLGSVIKPISEDVLVKKKPDRPISGYQGHVKLANVGKR